MAALAWEAYSATTNMIKKTYDAVAASAIALAVLLSLKIGPATAVFSVFLVGGILVNVREKLFSKESLDKEVSRL